MKKTMLKSLNHMGLTWRPDCMKCWIHGQINKNKKWK